MSLGCLYLETSVLDCRNREFRTLCFALVFGTCTTATLPISVHNNPTLLVHGRQTNIYNANGFAYFARFHSTVIKSVELKMENLALPGSSRDGTTKKRHKKVLAHSCQVFRDVRTFGANTCGQKEFVFVYFNSGHKASLRI